MTRFGLRSSLVATISLAVRALASPAVAQELEDSLTHTLLAPIDREDIHRLSYELDGIRSLTTYAARASVMCSDLSGARRSR